MHTEHRVLWQDSRLLDDLGDNSVDLVVTSPPYPLIEMWDRTFTGLNPEIGFLLEQGEARLAFNLMHEALDPVWHELYRVVRAGGFVCINIGDATRTIRGKFQLLCNHSRIQQKFCEIGFDSLPAILWRKPTNAPNKFMGSGMLPAGAYVTLEHEYILIFRKGGKRTFKSDAEKLNRMHSAIFWEERNAWYSDLWDLKGIRQELADRDLRKRSAAYPFLLPFRLVNMYSVFGDTVLDPFFGTGTTALAAMACGRNSVGCEIDANFAQSYRQRVAGASHALNSYNLERLRNHVAFIKQYASTKRPLKYRNEYFGFPVVTKQEVRLRLAFIDRVAKTGDSSYRADYLVQPLHRCAGTGELKELERAVMRAEGPRQLRFFD